MKRATSLLLAASLAVGGGVFVFQTLRADAGRFNGTIGGSPTGGAASIASLTDADVQAATLGEPMSFSTLFLTQANPAADSFVMNGGRLRVAPASVSSNAYFYYDLSYGLATGGGFATGAGQNVLTDSIQSRQQDRPPAVTDSHGVQLTPQSALGTCGTTAEPEGTLKALSGSSLSSRTRLCLCTSDGGGTPAYAWRNVTTGTVATSTTCTD